MARPEPSIVEVVYALPDRQTVLCVPLTAGLTAIEAVRASGLLERHPELSSDTLMLGVFGRRVDATHALVEGDRVEIYRPLRNDPREARRNAARAGARGSRTRAGRGPRRRTDG
ncbi:MAG: RnfH family protein [Lysobacterales bacterium]|nr:MAG: RnfH family protein [Xanthomonadales bacterium]